MPNTFTVYRGISRTEASDVLEEQRYFRRERVTFGNPNFGAHAVFGDGIYFIDDFEVAGQYAFCHGVHEGDDCTVLRQILTLESPLELHNQYGERQLRTDVLRWRLGTDKVTELTSNQENIDISLPESIRKYAIHHNYDGIIYLLPNGGRYFISYFPERQISDIQIDFEFQLREALYNSFTKLRISQSSQAEGR